FFFQAEDGIRDFHVTGVQTCALPISAFSAGARGWCTAAPNLIPELNIALYDAIQENDLAKAQRVFYKQIDLLKFIVAKGLPRSIKGGLDLLGVGGGGFKSPLKPLSENEIAELDSILSAIEIEVYQH